MILFRNHLRTHEHDKELYLQTKRSLAEKKWKYIQNYADAKSYIIEEIIAHSQDSKKSPNE